MPVRRHIDEDILLDYVEGRLDVSASDRVRDHLAAGCARCSEALSFWQRSLTRIRTAMEPAVPEWTTRRAYALFAPHVRERALWGRTAARLIFDSRSQLTTAGARDLRQDSFKLVFEAENEHIDLLIERENDRWSLSGQVLTDTAPDCGWSIRCKNADHAEELVAEADALGEFQIRGVGPGNLVLSLSTADRQIELPAVTV